MIHLGNWPWTSDSQKRPIDPEQYTNLSTQEKVWLRAVGPVPILAMVYRGHGDMTPQTSLWLAQIGFRQATIRLVVDDATDKNPKSLAGDMAAIAESFKAQIDPWLAWDRNIDCIFQVDNEPDLERRVQDPAEYVRNLDSLIAELQRIYPGRHFLRPPLAQRSPDFGRFLAALTPGLQKQPYVVWHWYWGQIANDDQANFAGSPEWAYQKFGKPVIVAECGNKTDKHNVAAVFGRWVNDQRIYRWHWWKTGGESYPEDNWDTDSANYAIAFAHDVYRPARAWPQNAPVVPPVVSPPGDAMPLAVAFVPSNQDKNVGALPGHNEAGNCRILAHDATQKALARGLNARYFEPALESTDKVEHVSLYVTFAEARAWLDQQAARGYKTCCLHIHTNAASTPDAGSSHTGYCVSTAVPGSKALGYKVAYEVGLVLGLGLLAYDYTGWLFDTELRPHPSAIIELTRHDRRGDLERLYAQADAVEDALLAGALEWAGESQAAPTELEALRRRVAELEARDAKQTDLLRRVRELLL